MADRAHMIQRIRNELGDFGRTFRHAFKGDGETDRYDLPVSQVSQADFKAFTLDGGTISNLSSPADYTIDYRNSVLVLTDPLADDITLIAEGTAYGLFSDEDLGVYLDDALAQHTHGATTSVRYRDASGHIRFVHAPVNLATLPALEEILVVILATVEALWTLTTDAATDIDVSTAEGTFVARSQRYKQLLNQIELLTEKYKTLSQQLNVGLFRVEISDLRRISRTTGRLVPLYVAREYDDTTYPIRRIPPIDQSHSELEQGPTNTDVPTVDLVLYAGDTYSEDFDLAADLTGCTVASNIRNWLNPVLPRVPNSYQYTPFTVEIVNAGTGLVRLSLTSTQTRDLSPYAAYDLQVTEADGTVTTYQRGNIRVDPQVTT